MASIYARGRKLWCRVRDEAGKWISNPTRFRTCHEGDDAERCEACKVERRRAKRYAREAQATIDERRHGGVRSGPHTVRSYSRVWLVERRQRGIAGMRNEEGRIRNHVLPRIGSMRLDELKPRTIRDLIRELRKEGVLSPRTIHHI